MNKEESRVRNSTINVFFGMLAQVITIVLSFATRTVFIKMLGEEYLGISGLFTNILSMLSLADLGFDVAIIYSMYQPIAQKDQKKIAGLMNFYKKVYVIIACGIFLVGILLIPFLGNIVNLEQKVDHIILYYLLYLVDTTITYLLANRVAIINADQKMYVVKKYTTIFKILQSVMQMIVLCVFKSFFAYLIIQIIANFLTNLYGAYKAKKMYPFVKDKKSKISKEEQRTIFRNVKSMFIYKIGAVMLTNTDSIIISKYISTVMVGFYNNYLTIISAINVFLTTIFTALTASVGNFNVTANQEKKTEILYKLDFIANWGYGFCSVCLFVLCNHFIGMVWGQKYVLSSLIIIAIVINFYIVGSSQPIILYRNTTGMFKEAKYIFLWTSVINIVLSILFAILLPTDELKLFGILIATPIARVLTNVWYEPHKLFRLFLGRSPKEYYRKKMKDFMVVIVTTILTWSVCQIFTTYDIISFFIKGFICLVLANLIYGIVYRNQKEFQFYKEIIVGLIKNKMPKKEGKS